MVGSAATTTVMRSRSRSHSHNPPPAGSLVDASVGAGTSTAPPTPSAAFNRLWKQVSEACQRGANVCEGAREDGPPCCTFSQLMVVDGPAGNGLRVLPFYRTLMTRGREDAYGEAGRRVGVAILSRGGSCHSKVIGEEAHTTIRAHLLRGEPHRARRRRPAVEAR